MRLFKRKHMMEYFRQILLTVTILLAAILLSYSGVTYYSTVRTIQKIQDDANLKVLSQANFNIDYTYQMVQNLAYYLYFDDSISILLKEKDLDSISQLDYLSKIRQLSNVVSVTSFVDSVIIYNVYNKRFISTGNNTYNEPLMHAFELYINKKNLKDAEFTTINYSDEKGNILSTFSYILRDWSRTSDSDKSVVIINIKPEWLFTNIKSINEIGQNIESKVFIMDNNQRIYSNSTNTNNVNSLLENSIKNRISESADNIGFFEMKEKGKRLLVSFLKNNVTGWCIFNEQSYAAIFSQVDKLRITFIAITLGILIVAIFLSYYFSKKLYKPLRDMLKHFINEQEISENAASDNNELHYMTHVYDQKMMELSLEKSISIKNKSYLNQYIIKRLLADSLSITENELMENKTYNSLKISLYEKIMIVVFKIDDIKQFTTNTSNDKNLYKFAIKNISEEIFLQEFQCELIDMKEDHFVLLFNMKYDPRELKPRINALISEIQKNIFEYYKISLTAAYCDTISFYNGVTSIYNQALYYINYRLIFGKGSIITFEMINGNENCKNTKLSDELVKKFDQAIKSYDKKQIDFQIDNIFNYISKMRFDNIMYSIHHLILLISQTVNEINSYRINSISLDMQEFNANIESCETLAEMKDLFMDLMIELSEYQKDMPNNKNEILVDTICGIIEDNYQDPNLSLQWVASAIKMSASYVGKIFKNNKKMSIAEYVNEIRLIKALEILKNEEFSVNRTFEIVGFTSQSYFFTLFKKKFGCTPKEYRFSKAIQMNMNNNL